MEEKKSVRELLRIYDELEPKNLTAQVLKVVGWIIIVLGVIYGLILGNEIPTANEINYPNVCEGEYNIQAVFISIVVSVIAGLLFISVSEIIKLLFKNLKAQNKTVRLLELLAENNKEDDTAAHAADDSKEE